MIESNTQTGCPFWFSRSQQNVHLFRSIWLKPQASSSPYLGSKHIGLYKFAVVWPQIPCNFFMFFPKITKKKVKNLDNMFFFIRRLYLNMSATFDDILLGTDDGWILLWWLVTKRYWYSFTNLGPGIWRWSSPNVMFIYVYTLLYHVYIQQIVYIYIHNVELHVL